MTLSRRQALGLFAAAPLATLLPQAAWARKPEVFQRKGAAINGFDPVAYFTDSAPVKGESSISAEWNGATWHFASASNRDTFLANPEQYAPVFGGYCAYAASYGSTAPTDPDAWTIHEGKLYLNYSLNVRKKWLRDVPGHIAKGLDNWPGILG